MGSAGERGGFNKPGGPMDEEPDLDLGPPIDLVEDSDNSAIYVQGLNDNVTVDDLADFLRRCGAKMNKITGQPKIHVYLDKETEKPKGDATVSYEDSPTAKAAVEWFNGKDFQGSKLKVSLAWKQPPMNSMWHGVLPQEGRGMPPLSVEAKWPRRFWWAQGSHGRPWRITRRLPPRRARGSQGNPSRGGNVWHRAGDWQCPNPGYETRTLPGEQNATSVRPQSPRASCHHPSHPQMVIMTEAALVA